MVGTKLKEVKAAISLERKELPMSFPFRSTNIFTMFLKTKKNKNKISTMFKLTNPKKKME